MNSIAKNIDCMLGMAEYPDKYFELAIVDPPYGIGFSDYERGSSGKKVKERYTSKGKKKWDYSEFNFNEYFAELQRVSKNQIIWGANYFAMPPTQGFIFWYKHQPVNNFADGEYAWTSFKTPATCFDFMYYGSLNRDAVQIHPTQKPVKLYKWLLDKYAKPGDKILDTHLGSGSSRIACYDYGFDFTGFELDKDYFDAQEKRFNNHISQTHLFKEYGGDSQSQTI